MSLDFRLWRKAHGLTQQQAAEALGITRQRIWRVESQGIPAEDQRLWELACEALDRQRRRGTKSPVP